ncbi:hypothetical protein [Mycobacterium tilburgii]|uniref:hypothetical protein n=1 Tax=Mycobacterium tilburgii TaxID=44467 RepID=UPI00389938C7
MYGRHQAKIRTIAGVYRDEASGGGNKTSFSDAIELVEKFAEAGWPPPPDSGGQDGHDRG